MGTAVILIVGLPETLWPRLDGRVLRMFKASLGPLAASVTLYYLGQWMGGLREDAVMNRITNWSAAVMGVLALGLALAALLAPPERFRSVFMATAVCNVLAVLPGFAASARAAMLGDRLARWMALATAVLGAMTTGLYLHGLYLHGLAMQGVAWPWLGTGTVLVTVVLTLGFFILTSALVGVRNREQRRLARLSRIQPGMEPATQLPTGSHLLTRVEDALWTAKRRQAQVGVVALYLDNLYEPLEGDNRSTEYQTGGDGGAHPPRGGLSLPGGHYHPRCFMVVITLDADRQAFAAALNRLRAYVGESIDLLGTDRGPRRFVPRVGMGVVVTDAADALARVLLDEAEQEARASVPAEEVDTQY